MQQAGGGVAGAFQDADLGVLIHPGGARLGQPRLEFVRRLDHGGRHQARRGGVEVGKPVERGEVLAAQPRHRHQQLRSQYCWITQQYDNLVGGVATQQEQDVPLGGS